MASKRVLIVDDEENIGRSLRMILEREGYAVNVCRSVAEFRRHPDAQRADAYLLDMKLPDGNGIDLLKAVRQNGAPAPAVMISGHGTIADAVEATRAGAFDFLEKPLSRDRVLLIGESGTGKELLAAHIHEHSPFATGPFVKVNCAAIPTELIESELFGHEKGAFTGATAARKGKFELADGGTLFLDEVGDLHANSQAKLLRVLQEGEFHRVGGERPIRVSVRVIAATNRDLGEMVAQDKFREDLYYRVSVVPIRVPALRERPQDIRLMAEYFLEDFCLRNGFRQKTFDDAVWPEFEQYKWPGNARELRNVVERMA